MRVCFNGLCFATKKPANNNIPSANDSDDPSLATNGDHDHVTTIRCSIPAADPQKNAPETPSVFMSLFKSDRANHSANMEEPNAAGGVAHDANANPFVVVSLETDQQNANAPTTTTTPGNDAMQLISEQIGQLCNDAVVQQQPQRSSSGPVAMPAAEDTEVIPAAYAERHAHLEQLERYANAVQQRDAQIAELQRTLRRKEEEIAELKSHLDKFQSVFPFSSRGRKSKDPHNGGGGGAGVAQQRQRAQGISAEPQNESQVMELMNQTFPKYDKEDR